MPELSERQKTILNAVIRDYVATAEPVASEHVVKRYRIDWSPATVRNELVALEEAGFLLQPHTSAGRVPTDRGYRFFINGLVHGAGAPLSRAPRTSSPSREERAIVELRDVEDPVEFMRLASRLLAMLTRSFVLAGFPEDDLYYKSGIHEVMRAPEFSDLAMVQEFGAFVDHVEDVITSEFDPADFEEPRTFIGSENPIREARRYGMIVSGYFTPFEKGSLIALIGPKRMDYAHHLALLRRVRELLSSE